MNSDHVDGLAADGPDPSGEAAPPGPLEETPKGEAGELLDGLELPRYTPANLERWSDALAELTITQIVTTPDQAEALEMAARFLADTAGTLRKRREAQREPSRARSDANRRERRRQSRQDRRRRGRR